MEEREQHNLASALKRSVTLRGTSFIPDFRDHEIERAHIGLFEGGTEPCEINAQQLATVINFAVGVGKGVQTLKGLTDLVARLGVRRVK